jgi:tetratricopeptide (TPR) repeat protein
MYAFRPRPGAPRSGPRRPILPRPTLPRPIPPRLTASRGPSRGAPRTLAFVPTLLFFAHFAGGLLMGVLPGGLTGSGGLIGPQQALAAQSTAGTHHPSAVPSPPDAPAGSPTVPLYDNLGTHHYAVSTSQPRAQAYFDQGLRLYYAFNHAEAIRSFEEAARLDPACAMCRWGKALALGPNINLPMDSASGVTAWESVREAMDRRHQASVKERALIEALERRYTAVPPADRAGLDSLYAHAMGELVRRYPADPEIATLHAEALMDLSPWNYWQDGAPRPDTPEILDRLEAVLAMNPDHPGANHLYIHAVEAVDPERAVPMAERLAALMPGAGHIVHMPGHIYIRVGRYEDAIRANEHAVHADENWIRDQNPELGVYTAGYYPHNYDFLAFAASMIGRREQAVEAAEAMPGLVPEEMLGLPGMTFLQHHRTRHLQMKVRFEMWEEVRDTPAPSEAFRHGRAMWHYAQGRALAAADDAERAARELERLRAIANDPEVAPLPLEFNTSGEVLRVAAEVLAGYIALVRQDHDGAVVHLREAAAIEDAMTYGEPPEWSVPVRQDLGAVLLQIGRYAEAERAFREDLERFPENRWSLAGLERSLRGRQER